MTTKTTRLSVDMNPKEHRRLKMLAHAQGMSVREFVLTLLEPILYPNKKPNKKTQAAIERIEKGIGLKTFDSVEEMWEELGLN